MKQLDSVMRELYAAKKRNAQAHQNVPEYLKFLLRSEKLSLAKSKAKKPRASSASKARST